MKKLRNTKKLIVAASALAVAVAVSAGATFAWFTSNDTVTVSGITAQVKSDSGENLMIAVGHDVSKTFKTSLDDSDLTTYLDAELDAVTYDGTSKTIQTVSSVDGGTITYTTASDGTYVKIPLTIRTTAAQDIYLGNSSKVVNSDDSSATSPILASADWMSLTAGTYTTGTVTYDENNPITAYVKNATRVGITTLSEPNSTEGNMAVWSPNEASFTGGELGVNSNTLNRDVADEEYNYYQNNLAGKYFEYINDLSADTVVQKTYSNYLVTKAEGTTNSIESNSIIATTAQYNGSDSYYAFIYVYVWIEGTDGDCFNNILGQELDATISFSVNASN